MSDWKTFEHYIEKPGWRVSKCNIRVGTKSVLRFRAWKQGSGKWEPLDDTFETAKAAVTAIEEMK